MLSIFDSIASEYVPPWEAKPWMARMFTEPVPAYEG